MSVICTRSSSSFCEALLTAFAPLLENYTPLCVCTNYVSNTSASCNPGRKRKTEKLSSANKDEFKNLAVYIVFCRWRKAGACPGEFLGCPETSPPPKTEKHILVCMDLLFPRHLTWHTVSHSH